MRTIDVTKYVKRTREAIRQVGRVVCLRDPLTADMPENLTPSQIHTILWLGQEELPMSEVARRLNATAGTMTGIVDRLEKLGFVERQRDAADRRVIRLRLTETGRTVCGRLDTLIEERIAALLGLLDEPDQAALVDIFEKLAMRAHALATAHAVDDGTKR